MHVVGRLHNQVQPDARGSMVGRAGIEPASYGCVNIPNDVKSVIGRIDKAT